MSIGAIMMIGLSLVQSLQEQAAIEDQAEAQQDELTRQQEEANLISQEEKSERALEADRAAASALVAMETVGGAGSLNDQRQQQEIHGVAGLDLARIEGNRRREVGALQATKKQSAKQANADIKASQMKFLGSAASTVTGDMGQKQLQTQALGLGPSGSPASSSQLSPRSTISLGARAQ
jgi:hypothetical protein